MKDQEEMREYWDYKLGVYYGAVLSAARGSGFLYIDRLQKLAEFPNVTEEKYIEILCGLRDDKVEVLPNPAHSPDKTYLKQLLKKIRSCAIEKENRPDGARGEDPIRLYFDEIAAIPLITPNEERDLIFETADGSAVAMERLIESSLFIPVTVAAEFVGKNALFLDLVQEGNMELMAAAEEFDYGKNISFFAYAAFRIKRKLMELTEEDIQTVKLPTEIAEDISRIFRYRNENGIEAADEALAKALDITVERVKAAKKAMNDIGQNEDTSAENVQTEQSGPDISAPQKNEAEEQLSKQVSQMLAALPEKEAKVIAMRFGIGYPQAMTAEEIAGKLGEDIDEIKKTEESAMRHLGN